MHETQLILTNHAYERYCQRVGPIDRDKLTRQLQEQIRQPDRRRKDYIQLADVWWRYGVQDGAIVLHTCYGRSHIDLPAAIRWAKRYKDRIALGGRDG